MILLCFFVGILLAVIGALPPGASNLAVVQTTLRENHKQSLKVSYGAGAGEVLLAGIAFSSGIVVQEFFEMNIWIQYVIAGILASVGLFFLITTNKKPNIRLRKRKNSKYLLGFMLSIINPPVLIYWVLVFSFLGKYTILSSDNSMLWIFLFLSGVFIGKVMTLFAYSKLGLKLQQRKPAKTSHANRFIGMTFLLLSFVQLTKLAFL